MEYEAKALERAPLPLFEHAEARRAPDGSGTRLPEMPAGQQVVEDYRSLRLSLKVHPLSFVREDLERTGAVTAAVLAGLPAGRRVRVAGLVLVRQRPGSTRGAIFATLEDETGVANVIVRPPVFERYRRIVLGARLLEAKGRVKREGIVVHVVAEHLVDRSDLREQLVETGAPSPSLEPPVAPADVVKHPMSDPRTALPGGRNFRCSSPNRHGAGRPAAIPPIPEPEIEDLLVGMALDPFRPLSLAIERRQGFAQGGVTRRVAADGCDDALLRPASARARGDRPPGPPGPCRRDRRRPVHRASRQCLPPGAPPVPRDRRWRPPRPRRI